MDLFIHENFFSSPWQVAYVFDPQSEEEGFFVWREGKLQKLVPCVIEDVPTEQMSVPYRGKKYRITSESLQSANVLTEAMPHEKIIIKSDSSRTLIILIVFTCLLLLCCIGGILWEVKQVKLENKMLTQRMEFVEKDLVLTKERLKKQVESIDVRFDTTQRVLHTIPLYNHAHKEFLMWNRPNESVPQGGR